MTAVAISLAVPGFALAAILADIVGGITGGGMGVGAAAGLATLVIEYCKNSNSANSNYKKLEDGV